MKVSYYSYKDYTVKAKGVGQTDEEILANTPPAERERIRKIRYSFVSSAYHAKRKKLYVGTTNAANDILVEFDPKTGKFRSCGADKSGLFTEHDVKIHKGLHLDEANDAIYFATATLSPLSKMVDEPGGVIARYDIKTNTFTKLGNPMQGEYFQSSVWDLKRKLCYLFTDRTGFIVYDLAAGKTLRYVNMESIPHNACLDDDGGVWGTYGAGTHAFFRYNPDTRKFEFPGIALPNAKLAANIQYPGAGPVDCMINGRDGYLYIGDALGELHRLDPRKRQLTYLGKPFPQRRIPGLAIGSDGYLYIGGGYRPVSMLSRYDRKAGKFEYLGEIRKGDKWMEYVHEINVVGKTVYAFETDNMIRNGFVWACEV
jgi:hypothetical protein